MLKYFNTEVFALVKNKQQQETEKIEIYLLSGKGENLRKKTILKGQALSQGMGLLPKLNFLFLVYTSH